MASMALLFLFFFFFFFSFSLFIAGAQDRAPHGIGFENPVALSPSAVEFFHPKTKTKSPCAEMPGCSPLSLPAHVEATQEKESKVSSTTQKARHGLGAGGVAGIVFGLALAVFLAMCVYYALTTRRANGGQANSVQPQA